MKPITRTLQAASLVALFAAAAFGQATTRTVTDTIRKPDGTAWGGATVKFALDKSTYTSTTSFPAGTVTATTDSQGRICVSPCASPGVALWTNAEGAVKTLYTATYPDGSTFQFRLAYGDGSAIAVPLLRAAGIAPVAPADPAYVSMQGLVTAHAAVKGSPSQSGHLQCGTGVTCTGGVISVSSGASALDDLTDVAVTSPAAGHALVFNGTLFVNRALNKSDVGLSNVDNTSDANKPVSTAQAAADALKLDKASNLSDLANAGTARTNLGLGTAATLNAPASGNAASGEVVKGSDTRLTDARTPNAHTHAESDVTGLVSDLAGKQGADSDLTAVAGLSTTGLVARTGAGTAATRTVSAGSSKIIVTNGDGVSGNPTVDLGTLTASDIPTLTSAKLSDFATAAVSAVGLNAAGVSGGQSITGGTGAGDSLTLNSTSSATKGKIFFGPNSAYDGANTRLGIGTTSPISGINLHGTSLRLTNSTTGQTTTDGTDISLFGAEFDLWNYENAPTVFGTANNERFRIEGSGLIGINNNSPGGQVHIKAKDASTKGVVIDLAASPSSTSYPFSVRNSSGTTLMQVNTDGSLTLPTSGFNFSNSSGTGIYSRTAAAVTIKDTFDILEVTNGRVSMRSDVVFRFGLSSSSGLSFSLCTTNTFCIGDGGANANGRVQANLGVQLGTTTAKGTCDSSARGTFYTEFGGAGTADKTYQCLKGSADTYSWVQVISAP